SLRAGAAITCKHKKQQPQPCGRGCAPPNSESVPSVRNARSFGRNFGHKVKPSVLAEGVATMRRATTCSLRSDAVCGLSHFGRKPDGVIHPTALGAICKLRRDPCCIKKPQAVQNHQERSSGIGGNCRPQGCHAGKCQDN